MALHLQARGLSVWFDLQRLHAGSVWADGLQHGIGDAARMVLVVSQAALDSPWTRAEWEGLARQGHGLVLAVFEPVELPELLRGQPCVDFRAGFEAPLARLADFLQGRGPPPRDPVPPPNRLRLPLRLPPLLWALLLALAAPALLALAALAVAHGPGSGSWARGWLWLWTLPALWVALRSAPAFWRRTIGYRPLKRALLQGLLLGLVIWTTVGFYWPSAPLGLALAASWLAMLVLYLGPLRRSATLLRWLPTDEDLQPLRRRVHQPLLVAGETLADAATAATSAAAGAPAPFSYALHAAAADRPLERRVQAILDEAGHRRVAVDDATADAPGDAPDHHIAILSNRSSQAWMQALTGAHAGRLVCLVASTIELGDRLADTARYQWVDFRDGDRRDIETLARSLADPQGTRRSSALEATPEAIDRWKVPRGVAQLRTVTELFGACALVFGLADFAGMGLVPLLLPGRAPDYSDWPRSLLLALNGGVLLWLGSQALVYRRLPAAWLLPLLIGATVASVTSARVLPRGLQDEPWLVLGVFLPFVLVTLVDARHWLPAFAPRRPDEVGVKHSVEREFHRRNVVKVLGWLVVLVLAAVAIGLWLPRGPQPAKASATGALRGAPGATAATVDSAATLPITSTAGLASAASRSVATRVPSVHTR